MIDRKRAYISLGVLFSINLMNFYDRQIIAVVTEPIRKEWQLTYSEMALLGTAFTLIYAAFGIPLGRLTDKVSRTKILGIGVLAWSLLTALSGYARNYRELFALRLGVGIGEAACAPAGTSLIGDLFPANRRAKALSIFMMGLPIGLALSYAISGRLAAAYGWRWAFYVAIIPGLICAVASFMMREPARGATETHSIGAHKREGSPYWLVLSIPTMWWIIASGALQNFNMYAIGSFLNPFLQQYHGLNIRVASDVSMVVNGLMGIPGLLLGGFIGDAIMRRRRNGRMIVGAAAILISVPLVLLALWRPRGDIWGFAVFMGLGYAAMSVYYSTVYSAIQDIIEPSLRGTAMALYFFAMYVLGASLGPYGTGFASDTFTEMAAKRAGLAEITYQSLEPFRAEGLHTAMYIIPILGALLALVLLAASRTVGKDMDKLQQWMKRSSEEAVPANAAAAESAK
ncbi:MAG TPA: MFS transporter [Blastocatellia bacterium]|nr:MFS transporter [Blastocatellia bacterium]